MMEKHETQGFRKNIDKVLIVLIENYSFLSVQRTNGGNFVNKIRTYIVEFWAISVPH